MNLVEALLAPTRITAKGTARIAVLDIERLPGIAHIWEPRTKYIPPSQIVEWPRTVCLAWRWYGQKRVNFAAEWQKGGYVGMLQKAWDVYNTADIIVTYNGINFDTKHLKAAWLEEGFPPPAPVKEVDLYRAVTRQFGFESKSLDSVTKRLGAPGKNGRYSISETKAAVNGNREAQRDIRTYCGGDVELTEWLYDYMRPWLDNHPFVGRHDDTPACNRCGSEELTREPSTYRAVVIDYTLYRCDHCKGLVRGGWHSRAALTRGVK